MTAMSPPINARAPVRGEWAVRPPSRSLGMLNRAPGTVEVTIAKEEFRTYVQEQIALCDSMAVCRRRHVRGDKKIGGSEGVESRAGEYCPHYLFYYVN